MTTKNYERGGITYKLTAYQHDGCFHVSWECPVCGVIQDMKDGCESEAQAFGRAQARVFGDHHLPVHVMLEGERP